MILFNSISLTSKNINSFPMVLFSTTSLTQKHLNSIQDSNVLFSCTSIAELILRKIRQENVVFNQVCFSLLNPVNIPENKEETAVIIRKK